MTSDSVQNLLESAIRAAKAGDRSGTYQLLRQAIATDPSNEAAWLWLAAVTDQPREAQVALRRVERLNPQHPKLAEARRWLEIHLPVSAPAPQTAETLVETPAAEEPQAAPGVQEAEVVTEGLPTKERDTKPVPPVSLPSETDVTTRGATTKETPAAPARHTPRRARRILLIILLALALAVALTALAFILWFRFSAAGIEPLSTPDNPQRALALQPQLNAAIADSRWEDAIGVLQVMRILDPSNPAWQQSAASAYYQLGVQLRQRGDLPEALAALDESLKLVPGAPFVQQQRRLLVIVIEGLKHYEAKDWQAAIDALTPVYRKDAAYADVSRWLSNAYYNLGLDLQAAGDLLAAQAAYLSAAELMPDQLAARRKVEEIAWLLRPPTPTMTPTPTRTPTPTVPPKPTATPTPTLTPTPDPADQLILVDISEQRMYVYENDRLIWDWVASTGESGKDTAPGTFAVRDKIETAYASTWNLDMPYWLGIYQSGPLENGIHALPIQRANGIKLWEGFLGRRVSYGCVILSDENARTLFEWAQVGTPVTIRW